MKQTKYLLVIGGATATGKTALSIQLARHFRTDILSADSRQFYREMNIGTAKPSPDELAAAPHHFINSLTIGQDYSVGDYEKDALDQLEQVFKKNNYAILAGGSGLYIRAVCEGLDSFPEVPPAIKADLTRELENNGISALQQELLQRDPVYYHQVDLNNPQRLLRALSVCRASGLTFSGFQSEKQAPRPFEPVYILLQMERKMLYDRINRRVDLMMETGLLDEARALYPHRHLNALQTVGYQELFAYFDGDISLEEAINLIKQNSRRYAKRQETWFRKSPHWNIFSPADSERIIDFIAKKTKG